MCQKDSLGKARDIKLLIFTGSCSAVWSREGVAGTEVAQYDWQYL